MRTARGVHIALFAAVLMSGGCASETVDGDSAVVATVDGSEISAREFRLSYELGFPHLKTGADPVGAYLDRMIDEKLLSVEGRRRGLDTTAYVRVRVQNLAEQLMVEEVFRKHVNNRVRVTDEQIDAYHRREHVRFRLRYLPAPTREGALRLAGVHETGGFDAAVSMVNRMSEAEDLPREAFETGYLSHDELEPDVLEAIADAPMGSLVGPIRQRGSFLMIEVADIRREPMTPNPSPEERERYRQVIFQQESARLARSFVSGTMEPVGMRLRGPVYRELESRLWTWMRREADAAVGHITLADRIRRSADPSAEPVRDLFDEVVMTTRDAEWTVERFLREYPVARYPLSTDSHAEFRSDLYNAFGLTLRDGTFIRMAKEDDLLDSDSLRRVIRLWEDKWTYEALARSVRTSIDVSDDQARAYFDRHRDFWQEGSDFADVRDDVRERALRSMTSVRLAEELDRLHDEASITVDRTLLDTMKLSAPGAPPVSVVALHTGRPAFPVVDPSL